MKTCDLVMKGGITSGVVYPEALIGLSSDYVFAQIGGASAGAIAAAFAAAAEYDRTSGGFDRLRSIPAELGRGLSDLFQPYPEYRRVFDVILDLVENKKKPGLCFALRNFFRLKRALNRLPDTDFGACPGTTTSECKGEGLTDWLNRRLEFVAGRIPSLDSELPEVPLTFGMLQNRDVRLKLITTNLSQNRPEALPLGPGFSMRGTDLGTFLPRNVANWIRGQSDSIDADYLPIPDDEDMPVILAVRMSLSFPILFSAIPLYAIDYSLRNICHECETTYREPKLNYFSDGGISSNFPIHYFDQLVPERPTFGVSLTGYEICRQGPDPEEPPNWNRIYMPSKAGGGMTHSTHNISNLGSFVFSILSSAKDWQDNMRTRMSGYRERVVHVALKNNEGGINLNMQPETIQSLLELGGLVAERIKTGDPTKHDQQTFSFNAHRWRRLLSTMEALEDQLPVVLDAYKEVNPKGDPASGSLSELLKELETIPLDAEIWEILGYKPPNAIEISKLRQRISALNELVDAWKKVPRDALWNMPSPTAALTVKSTEI